MPSIAAPRLRDSAAPRGGLESSAFLDPGSSAAPHSPSEMPVAWQERGHRVVMGGLG